MCNNTGFYPGFDERTRIEWEALMSGKLDWVCPPEKVCDHCTYGTGTKHDFGRILSCSPALAEEFDKAMKAAFNSPNPSPYGEFTPKEGGNLFKVMGAFDADRKAIVEAEKQKLGLGEWNEIRPIHQMEKNGDVWLIAQGKEGYLIERDSSGTMWRYVKAGNHE